MNYTAECYKRNIILFRLGAVHFFIALALAVYYPFNHTTVLGLNAVVKPIKFALSISIYSFTMAWLLYYLQPVRKVRLYSRVAVLSMGFEQLAISFQALRGQQSHFNRATLFNNLLYTAMGIFIITITLWTGYMAYLFIKQRSFIISRCMVLGIRIGMIFFVVFSLFGAYVSQQSGHTVGSTDGGSGLPFLNWSRLFGDLRVGHFFGIHALQLIPLLAFVYDKNLSERKAILATWVSAILYFIFVAAVIIQSLAGHPFW